MIEANIPSKAIVAFRNITIVLGIVVAVYIIVLAPVVRSAKDSAQSHVCQANLKKLSSALVMYTQDWDGHYPPASKWMDCIDNDEYLGQDRATVFHCPAAVSQYGYAMNAQVSGKSDQSIDIANTVLLFETDSPTRNASGTQNSLALPRHHMLNCAFCGGSTAWVNPYTESRWKWTVTKPQ